MQMMKFAVTPGFQTGGTIFKPEQLAVLGSIVGEDAKIELTTFKQYGKMKEKFSKFINRVTIEALRESIAE